MSSAGPSDSPSAKTLFACIPESGQLVEVRRRQWIVSEVEGSAFSIGALMNKVHDRANSDGEILDLRVALKDLDIQVLRSYGWSDLIVEYEFREIGKGQRLGLETELAKEVLNRLLELNHRYYEDEVARGLHNNAIPRAWSSTPGAGRTTSAKTVQPLLDFETGTANTI